VNQRTANSAVSDENSPNATNGQLWAWSFYDWANNGFATLIQTFVYAVYFSKVIADDETTGQAQWSYAIGVAGAFVAISGPILGAVADQGGRRKPWLAAFTGLCVLAMVAMGLLVTPDASVMLALGLLVVGTIGAEAGMIFYNAMLPDLAAPARVGRWSGWGSAMGYIGGLICLILALALFIGDFALLDLPDQQQWPVRAAVLLAGGWYAVFALPLLLRTPDRPSTRKPIAQATRDGLRQLIATIRHVRQYGHIVRFLIARLLYIDGIATIFVVGGIYAGAAFGLDEQEILFFAIALNVAAGVGAFGLAWVDDWIGGKRTILLALAGITLGGLPILIFDTAIALWVGGCVLGLFVGPAQAASRSYMARVAPQRMRTEMFGLYAFSGKATAFAGPLLVGAVTDWTDSARLGMATIFLFILSGAAVLLTVPKARKLETRGDIERRE
jgi:UMF1 family MFS transporter